MPITTLSEKEQSRRKEIDGKEDKRAVTGE